MSADEHSDVSINYHEQRRRSVERLVAKRNGKATLSERGIALGQYVRDLYASGAKLWTMDMFSDVEAELAKEPLPKSIMIRSMNGDVRPVEVIRLSGRQLPDDHNDEFVPGLWHMFPDFDYYQTLVQHAEEHCLVTPDESLSSITDADRASVCRAIVLRGTRHHYSRVEFGPLKAAWDEAVENWTRSDARKELIATINSMPHVPRTISKLVCFGLGSLSCFRHVDKDESERKSTRDGLPLRRCITQHAAAMTMAEAFGKRVGKEPLPILVQDPAYSEADKRVLKATGFEVISGRGALGFTYVDDDTIVFSIAPNVPVKQIVADIARPAFLVWCEVKSEEDESTEWHTKEAPDGSLIMVSPWLTDQDSPRTRKLVEDYTKYKFPDDDERFGGLGIYARND